MDNLPTIETEEIIIPTTEEKRTVGKWVTQFSVTSDDPQNTRLYAILRPQLNTGEILVKDGTEDEIIIDDIFGVLQGTKIEPKLTPETIAMGGQLMGLTLMFLKAVLKDKAVPDPEPVLPPEEDVIPVTE